MLTNMSAPTHSIKCWRNNHFEASLWKAQKGNTRLRLFFPGSCAAGRYLEIEGDGIEQFESLVRDLESFDYKYEEVGVWNDVFWENWWEKRRFPTQDG